MEVIIKTSSEEAGKEAARIVRRQILKKPASVIGFATGSTPLKLYSELVALFQSGSLDFSQVIAFSLDEYVGLSPNHSQSYAWFLQEHLFGKLNIVPEKIHAPDGMAGDIAQHCEDYEKQISQAGGIDLQILGLGSDGHIGFNEPGSSLASRTRLKSLTGQTIADNARFFNSPAEIPRHVITMGVGTIMDARHCVILANGIKKAKAVAAMVEGPVTASLPASILQMHRFCTLIIDEKAACQLQRTEYYLWVYKNKPEWQKA